MRGREPECPEGSLSVQWGCGAEGLMAAKTPKPPQGSCWRSSTAFTHWQGNKRRFHFFLSDAL